ncbi:PilX N-terminal domain-containing pilus assembly protein [Psychrobacter sp. HII-4]|uniref:pilus assembly PilX family protein n=1 Tax=Psychrobacter sp. HII-4 TaxID=1569264 RepID=UPI0039B75011
MRKRPSISYPSSSLGAHNQSGAVLIVVLFVLILIMIVGTIAVRQSTTDLKVATADQVNKILFQANDAALMKVEKEDRILSERRGNVDTLKGYMSATQREGHEVSFCVRPRSTRLFSILEISELNKNGGLLNSRNNGYCDPTNDDDYVSEGRVMTQMTFVRPVITDDEGILDREVVGTYSNNFDKPENGSNTTIECTTFVGYVTSVIPALSQEPMSAIASCLKKPRTGTDTVDSCLTALGVPFQTQQQIYLNQPVGVECISGS